MRRRYKTVEALPALTLLLYLLISEVPAVWLLFLSALIFHEWGHLCAFRLVGSQTPLFRLAGVGARLTPALPLLPWQEAVVAAAGPLSNLLFALIALRVGSHSFLLLAAVVHLLFGLGNLLPFGGCDGERLLRLLFVRLAPRAGEALLSFLGGSVLAFFFYFSLFLYYLTGNGLCGVFFSLYFLLDRKNALPYDF